MTGAVRSMTFPGDVSSVGHARHWVLDVLADLSWSGPTDDVVLLVSELATNAVLYSPGLFDVMVYAHHCGLWVSVADCGDGRTIVPRHPGRDELSGRGLAIVQAASSAWGTSPDRMGKAVWFEVPT